MSRDCFITSIDGGNRRPFRITNVTHYVCKPTEITGYFTDSEDMDAFFASNDGIDRVIFNNPATIVIWNDGSKTVVKCQPDDEYDREKGLLLCIAKKHFGNKGNFNEVLKKYISTKEETPKKRIKIIDAGDGALGANGYTGYITSKESTHGLLNINPGYNVKCENGEIWRIHLTAEIVELD